MWWGRVRIDMSKFPLLNFTRFHGCVKHYICFALLFKVYFWGYLSGWFQSLSSHVQVYHCRICWFFNMLLDEIFCESCPILQETFFGFLDEAWWCWDLKFCMKILWQFWFSCIFHNGICHNFWLLCIQGNFPLSLFLNGAFYHLLSVLLLIYLSCLVLWCIHHDIILPMILVGLF